MSIARTVPGALAPLLLVLFAGLSAACSDAAEPLSPPGIVVERHLRLTGGTVIVGALADEAIERLNERLAAEDLDHVAAFQPTLVVDFGEAVRDIVIPGPCYVTVQIGDSWPSDEPECQ